MYFITILILFLTGLLPVSLLFYTPRKENLFVGLLLSFSGAYLFSFTILKLLPDLYLRNQSYSLIGFFILIGFFVQLTLERFTSGAEHGHFHVQSQNKNNNIIPFGLYFSLCIHAFLEGVPVMKADNLNLLQPDMGMLLGISLHKIPEALALGAILFHRLENKKLVVLLLLLYALICPAGVVSGETLIKNFVFSVTVYDLLLALVCGLFLHVSTTVMFEAEPEHKLNIRKLLLMLGGVLVAILFS